MSYQSSLQLGSFSLWASSHSRIRSPTDLPCLKTSPPEAAHLSHCQYTITWSSIGSKSNLGSKTETPVPRCERHRSVTRKWELQGRSRRCCASPAENSTCYTLSAFRTPTSRKESSVQPRVVEIIGTARTALQVDCCGVGIHLNSAGYLFPFIAYLQLQHRQRHGNVIDRVVR